MTAISTKSNKKETVASKTDAEPDNTSNKALLDRAKSQEATMTFTAARFSNLDKDRATQKVALINDVKRLKKVRVELEGFQGTKMHRDVIDNRIAELEPKEDDGS